MNILDLIGRKNELLQEDILNHNNELSAVISRSSFLVIGGAGSIGQAVSKEILKRQPRKLHVVDISENNLAELMRDIRSAFGNITGDFQAFALDILSVEYDAFIKWDGQYDYIFNLSALKHVRSEKDAFTLMRMINLNIFGADKIALQAIEKKAKKYFCVSTDKAANPANMMGGSKRIMELFLFRRSSEVDISTARFANVAFSDGSLLHGFDQRIKKMQPIVAPYDVKRYFITPKESGELCLISCILGENRDIFFPKLSEKLHLLSFSDIAVKYLNDLGYEPYVCDNEEDARRRANTLIFNRKWPCLFSISDTTGEKYIEEFFTSEEKIDTLRFKNLGIVKNELKFDYSRLNSFIKGIVQFRKAGKWTKEQLLDLFVKMIPDFDHIETGKYLDSKM